MFKYLACCLLALSLAGYREKTDLEKSYAFAEKAGWHFMREKLRGQTDTLYTPDTRWSWPIRLSGTARTIPDFTG